MAKAKAKASKKAASKKASPKRKSKDTKGIFGPEVGTKDFARCPEASLDASGIRVQIIRSFGRYMLQLTKRHNGQWYNLTLTGSEAAAVGKALRSAEWRKRITDLG